MKHLLIFILSTLLLAPANAQERIIILNEGNWQADNGRMSYFEDGAIVSNKWFRDKNGMKLGDTPNDIIQINDNLLAVAINWSNIVQFITPEGLAVAATEDVPNNRKLCTDGRYVYVTSYGHECGTIDGMREFTKGYVAKIDISDFKVVDAVEVGYEPEGIAIYKGLLFVANSGGYAFNEDHPYETIVSVIDAATMKPVREVDTGQINLYGKMSQSGQYLCINSPGDYYDISAATIILDCRAVLEGKPDSECFTKLEYAATCNTTDRLGNFLAIGSRYSYYTSDYQFDYSTIAPATVTASGGLEGVSEDLPGTMLEDIKAMQMPYAIYVNPYTGYMYATDAGGFNSAGTLYQWDPDGKLLGKHKIYINPGHILALPPDGHFSGIEPVLAPETGSTATDGKIYNLQGMVIDRPSEGQIYIRNGRKYIHKTR